MKIFRKILESKGPYYFAPNNLSCGTDPSPLCNNETVHSLGMNSNILDFVVFK